MEWIIIVSVSLMLLFVFLKSRLFGVLAWFLFGISWILKIPYYVHVEDYFNVSLLILAFLIFSLIAFAILKTNKIEIFVRLTSLSALAAIAYFPFALNDYLKEMLIKMVANHTVLLGNLLGFHFYYNNHKIIVNDKTVNIILACTGIESMALFFGVTMATKAEFKRNLAAFLVSVPTIYFLNLLRNIFVSLSYGYSWFGENSFYIAHHVISKFLATLALILISLAVFKIIPELLDLLYDVKNEIKAVVIR